MSCVRRGTTRFLVGVLLFGIGITGASLLYARSASSYSLPSPAVTSTTHPDQEQWYPTRVARFQWDVPAGVTEVRLALDPRPSVTTRVRYAPPISEKVLPPAEDGIWYFKTQFGDASGLGPITVVTFKVDATPPLPFSVTRVGAGDPTDPRPELSFATSDATSGIGRYELFIGDEPAVFIMPSALSAGIYKLPLRAPGTWSVTVKAIDNAGNIAAAAGLITVEPIERPAIKKVTRKISEGQILTVGGTAPADAKVNVRIVRSNDPLAENTVRVRTTAGSDGQWAVEIGGIPAGSYVVYAQSEDGRGALSLETDSVPVYVNRDIFGKVIHFVSRIFTAAFHPSDSWFPFSLILYVILASLLIDYLPRWFAFLPLWYRKFRMRRRAPADGGRHPGLLSEGDVVLSELKKFHGDIDRELKVLSNIAKHRQLYPDERYLKEKLSKYHRTLRGMLGIHGLPAKKARRVKRSQKKK